MRWKDIVEGFAFETGEVSRQVMDAAIRRAKIQKLEAEIKKMRSQIMGKQKKISDLRMG